MTRIPLVFVAAAVSVPAAGCGGGGSPAASPRERGALAFARCMRSNGVPAFPDPGGSGSIPKESLQQRQQARAQALSFSQSVRARDVPNFPDPADDVRIPDPASVGIDQGSPAFEPANADCGKYRPPYMPSNAAYGSWARTHAH